MTNLPDEDSTAVFRRKMDELRAHPVHVAKKKLDDLKTQGNALADNLEMLEEAIKNLKQVMATKPPGQRITQEEQDKLKELGEKSKVVRLSINKLEKEYTKAIKDHALKNTDYINMMYLRNIFYNNNQITNHLKDWDKDIESSKNMSFLQHCSHGFKQRMTSFWDGLKQLMQGFIEKITQTKSEKGELVISSDDVQSDEITQTIQQQDLTKAVNNLLSDCFDDNLDEDLKQDSSLHE